MSDIDLVQEFENSFNCYTQLEHADGGDTEEMAMSKDKFIEVVSKLLQANVAPTKDSGLHLQRVSIAERKLPVAAVIRRNAKLMDAEHFDAWYNEVTGN